MNSNSFHLPIYLFKQKSTFMLISAFGFSLFMLSACINATSSGNVTTGTKPLDDTIKPAVIVDNGTFKNLKLVKVIQSKTATSKDPITAYESAINSPKSVTYTIRK